MIVVTDTSVVLNLAWLRQDALLPALFDAVLAPSPVVHEFERLACADDRFRGLQFPGFITVAEPLAIPAALASDDSLDPGEIAALALALERGIRDVLIDDAAARTAALNLGLQPAGLLGLLVQAKKRELVPDVLPLVDRLRDGARFRVDDDLRHRIAVLSGENP